MKKILVVEDDCDLALGLTVRLRANPYQVLNAHDAVSAVDVATQELPDLVILDLGLPGGDGLLVMERMRQRNSLVGIPVIVLTAQDPDLFEKASLLAGAQLFLRKPVENTDLINAVRNALGESLSPAS
jgi:two-component system KDP operon response regulator KdpE